MPEDEVAGRRVHVALHLLLVAVVHRRRHRRGALEGPRQDAVEVLAHEGERVLVPEREGRGEVMPKIASTSFQ